MHGHCVVCASTLNSREETNGLRIKYDCPLCGRFVLSGTLEATIPSITTADRDKGTLLSYAIRKMQHSGRIPFLDSYVVDQIMATTKLPTPLEQANELILWLGKNIKGPGENVELASYAHRTIIGAKSPAGFKFVIDYLKITDLADCVITTAVGGSVVIAAITLTFKGWERYFELERGTSEGKKVFMAMKYGDAVLDEMFIKVFQPAVEQTGFRLERLIDNPKAGLIDNRLRVEILTSRFLIADLTHGNAGAYWEAGHAEGLGKPVIYMCEETVFERNGTHFDTNHHYTVRWRKEKPKESADDLKATIRATLPAEAKLEDE